MNLNVQSKLGQEWLCLTQSIGQASVDPRAVMSTLTTMTSTTSTTTRRTREQPPGDHQGTTSRPPGDHQRREHTGDHDQTASPSESRCKTPLVWAVFWYGPRLSTVLDCKGGRNYMHRLHGVRGRVCVGLADYRYPGRYPPTGSHNSTRQVMICFCVGSREMLHCT